MVRSAILGWHGHGLGFLQLLTEVRELGFW
jgi:hypothetical protein